MGVFEEKTQDGKCPTLEKQSTIKQANGAYDSPGLAAGH